MKNKTSKSSHKLLIPGLLLAIISVLLFTQLNKSQQGLPLTSTTDSDFSRTPSVYADHSIYSILSSLRSYTKTSPAASYDCYTENFPNSYEIKAVQKEVSREDSSISYVCINNDSHEVLVSSKKSNNELLKTDIYAFKSEDDYYSEPVIYGKDHSYTALIVHDWLQNGDIIFTITGKSYNGGNSYTLWTHVFNNTKDISPSLIEYCLVGIGGGTSERGIIGCKSFNNSTSSNYIQQNELP